MRYRSAGAGSRTAHGLYEVSAQRTAAQREPNHGDKNAFVKEYRCSVEPQHCTDLDAWETSVPEPLRQKRIQGRKSFWYTRVPLLEPPSSSGQDTAPSRRKDEFESRWGCQTSCKPGASAPRAFCCQFERLNPSSHSGSTPMTPQRLQQFERSNPSGRAVSFKTSHPSRRPRTDYDVLNGWEGFTAPKRSNRCTHLQTTTF